MSYKYYKKYIYIIMVIVLISIIAIFSTILDEKLKSVSTIFSNSSKEIDENKEYFIIGEEARVDDCIIYVNSITKSQESEVYRSKNEKDYLIIDVTLKNIGKNNIDYNPFYFKLESETGDIKDAVLDKIDKHSNIKSGILLAEQKLNGTLVFEKTSENEELFLVYKPDMLSNRSIKIKLY